MIQPATLPRTWPYMVMAPCHSDEDADLNHAEPHEDFCQWLARQQCNQINAVQGAEIERQATPA